MYDVNVISIIYNGDLSTLFHSSGLLYIYIYIICVYSKKKVSVYSFNNSFFAFKDIVYKYHGYQKHSDKKNKIKGKNKQITNVKLKVRALQ